MEIKRNGMQPPGNGPAEWLTGAVWTDPLSSPLDKAMAQGIKDEVVLVTGANGELGREY